MYSGYAFTLAAVLMAIGGVGLVLALVGRRSLRRPSCAACGADARGQAWSDAPRCSACNADLRVAGALRLRGRDRSWRWIVAWLVVIGLGGGLWYADRAINEPFGRWDIAVIPTWWDIRQLSSTDVERSETAAWRLVDRVQWDGVTDDELESTVEAILARIDSQGQVGLPEGVAGLLEVLVCDPRFREEWLERCRPLFGDARLSLSGSASELSAERSSSLGLAACVLVDEVRSGETIARFLPRWEEDQLAPNGGAIRANRIDDRVLGTIEWPHGAPSGEIEVRWRAVYVPTEISRAIERDELATTSMDPKAWGVRSLVVDGVTRFTRDGGHAAAPRVAPVEVSAPIPTFSETNEELRRKRPWLGISFVVAAAVAVGVGFALRLRPRRWARLTVPACRRCDSKLSASDGATLVTCAECGGAAELRAARFARCPSRWSQRAILVAASSGLAAALFYGVWLVRPYVLWMAVHPDEWPTSALELSAFRVALAHGDATPSVVDRMQWFARDKARAEELVAILHEADPLLLVRTRELVELYMKLIDNDVPQTIDAEFDQTQPGEEFSQFMHAVRGSECAMSASHLLWRIESVEISGTSLTPIDGRFVWKWPRDRVTTDVVVRWYAMTPLRRSAIQVERMTISLKNPNDWKERNVASALTDPVQSPFTAPPLVSLAAVGERAYVRVEAGDEDAHRDPRIRGTWTIEADGRVFTLGGEKPTEGFWIRGPRRHTVEAIIGPLPEWPPEEIVLVFHPQPPSADARVDSYWAVEDRTTLKPVRRSRWPSATSDWGMGTPNPLFEVYEIHYAPEPAP